jgi:hypothetical protein
MRQIRLFILLIAIPAAFLFAQTDPPGRVGRLSYSNGPVSFQPAGVTEWVDADVNRPLTTGDQVWVGAGGRAEIHVGSTALRLDSNTAFQFLNLDDQTAQIQLSQGTLTVRVRNLAQDQNLELDTPNMAFTMLRPGEYRIGADPDSQTTTVTVRGGSGEVTGGGQAFPVQSGQQAIVNGSDQITYSLVPAPRADQWDQWSSSRDLREDQSVSARYVSREMDGYEDLDQYGGWSDQPGYGQVWMPTSVSAGWAPYHDGHWAWIAPWGWTWVDDLPWGFAPFHYGRWSTFGGRWGWIPGPYGVAPMYAPALVGWIGGGGGGSGFSLSFSFGNAAAIGWFPLGPREPYFPAYNVSSGYFGRVNHSNTVINTTVINNYYNDSRSPNNTALANIRYANRSVPNAVMAVPQDRFANGRRVGDSSRVVTAAQLGSARIAAAPEIAPQRASVLGPRAAEAARAPRPPANVLSRPVVARTAPPPAPVPFDRQQAVLNQNPGRPLPAASVQQMRQNAPARTSPVRVVDMGKVQRVQPVVGAGPQDARPVNPAPGVPTPQPPVSQQRPSASPPPAANVPPVNAPGRQNGRWAAPVARPDAPSPNVNRQQQNAPPAGIVQQPTTPPPAAINRSNTPPANVDRQQQNAPPANVNRRQQNAPPANVAPTPSTPPPAANNRPNAPAANVNRQQQNTPPANVDRQQQNAPPANVNRRQQNAPPADVASPPSTPPPAANNRSNAPPANVDRQQQNAPPASRQQQPQVDRAAPAQSNRPEAQNPQPQPPQPAAQAQPERQPPPSSQKGAKGKKNNTDQ